MVKGNYISTIPNVVPFQFTSKHVPFCSYLGLIFPFSHNPVLWRNAGLSQLCVLSQPSCVDLTRQSQTCWRQPPDVIHSPRRALPSLADSPPSPVHQQRGELRRRSEIWLADRFCHSTTRPIPSSHVWLEKIKENLSKYPVTRMMSTETWAGQLMTGKISGKLSHCLLTANKWLFMKTQTTKYFTLLAKLDRFNKCIYLWKWMIRTPECYTVLQTLRLNWT